MGVTLYIVEAFTTGDNDPYTGNPAAVCILENDDDIPDAVKQRIANTMNLSETAFVALGWTKGARLPEPDTPTAIARTIRWFTPTDEVPLCGHATLASSFALLAHLRRASPELALQQINFESKQRGTLIATLETTEDREYFSLNFPANSVEAARDVDNVQIAQTFLGPDFKADDVIDVQVCSRERVGLVRIASSEEGAEWRIKAVKPNMALLRDALLNGVQLIGAIVTVQGNGGNGADLLSRFFAPVLGVPEDPVTGLAHTILTPYWTAELKKEGEALLARQASARGGDMRCRLNGDRVSLSGRGRVVVEGSLNL